MNDETLAEVLAHVRGLNAYHLSSMADCASPSSLESQGAQFLSSVADAFAESLEYTNPDDIGEWIADASHEIADGAPDIYTHRKWAQFVDVAAYNENPTDLGADGSDMDQSASVCLYIIAERLAHALADSAQELLDAAESEDAGA